MNQNPPYVPAAVTQAQDEEIDIVRYLDILVANRWLIAAVLSVVFLLGVAYAFLVPPVYRADILVQVEDTPGDPKSLLGDVSSLFDVKTQAAAEIEILSSRMVVDQAVNNLLLYIDAKPKYFPVIGERIASNAKGLSTPGLFGLGGYAWAGESIKVDLFDVPVGLEGEEFRLTVLPGGRFKLAQRSLDHDIEGNVGQRIDSKQSVGAISFMVSEIRAKPGIQFRLTRNSKLKTLAGLQEQLNIAEKGKQSGIIGASLEGNDAKLTASTLNEIGEAYVAQNIRRKSEEAEKSLAFLGQLLPQLKLELEQAEVKYNEVRNKRGTFDLSEEAKAYLQESVSAETGLLELKQKRAELLTRFKSDHPSLQALDAQISALASKSASINGRIKALPDVEQDTFRLMRDVKVNNELYVGLLNSMQQLKLVKAGKVGNVRLVDEARVPEEPVKPKKLLVAALAAVLGAMVGVAAAFLKDAIYGGISDSQDIEQRTGLNVYATVPLSQTQVGLAKEIQSRKRGHYLLAARYPNEPSIESLRSLRTAVQFSMLESDNNRILLTGPTPGVGKSFVSANLAAVLAAGGKRVLLIDADLRKGYLNQYFGKDRSPGLSDLLIGEVELSAVVHHEVAEGLDFIGTGTIPPNPAELLMSDKMTALLADFSEQYDIVLIDTPPVLAVSDASILASQCGVNLLVTRFEKTTIGEITECAKQLRHANVSISGAIFNGIDAGAFRYRYGSKYGRYRYAYYDYQSPSAPARGR